MITIEWSILTDGGEPIVQFLVDWIEPGSHQFTRVPGGAIESGATYFKISLGIVLAGRSYQYRVQAVNSEGYISCYVSHELRSSKGT